MTEPNQRLNRLGVTNDPKPYYRAGPGYQSGVIPGTPVPQLPFTKVNDMSPGTRPRPVLWGTFLTSFVRRDL